MKEDCEAQRAPHSRAGTKEDRQHTACYRGKQERNPETNEVKDVKDGNVADVTLTPAGRAQRRAGTSQQAQAMMGRLRRLSSGKDSKHSCSSAALEDSGRCDRLRFKMWD